MPPPSMPAPPGPLPTGSSGSAAPGPRSGIEHPRVGSSGSGRPPRAEHRRGRSAGPSRGLGKPRPAAPLVEPRTCGRPGSSTRSESSRRSGSADRRASGLEHESSRRTTPSTVPIGAPVRGSTRTERHETVRRYRRIGRIWQLTPSGARAGRSGGTTAATANRLSPSPARPGAGVGPIAPSPPDGVRDGRRRGRSGGCRGVPGERPGGQGDLGRILVVV